MATLGQLAGQYGSARGENQEVPLTYSQAQNQLAMLKQYDPNASLVNTGQQGDAGTGMGKQNADGTWDDSLYTLNYDKSKLPQLSSGAAALQGQNPGVSGTLVNFNPNDPTFTNQTAFGGHQMLKDPSQVVNDPTYGWLTPSSNYSTNYTGTKNDMYNDMIGHAIAMTALGVMGGGLAAAAGGGMGGALASGALNQGWNMAQGGSFNPMSLATSALGGADIPGLDSIMPYLKLAQGAYGASKGNIGAGVNTIGNLAKMGGFQMPQLNIGGG